MVENWAADGDIGTREYYKDKCEELYKRISDLEKENEDMEHLKIIGELQAKNYEKKKRIEHLTLQILAVNDKNKELRAALEKYGAHLSNCPAASIEWYRAVCECGLDDALLVEAIIFG